MGFELPITVTLRDGREVCVRRLVEDDAPTLLELLPRTHGESDFLAYLPGEFNFTLEQEKEFIRGQHAPPGNLLLAAEHVGRIVAIAGTHGTKFRRQAHHRELGVTVLREYWGLGLGRALMSALIEWGVQEGLRKLTLRVFADHVRGIALYRSLGFVEEGRLRGDALRVDGTYSDTIVMGKFLR